MLKGKRFLIVSAGVILVATLMPMDGNMAGSYLDKVAHFLMYFVLGFSVFITFKDRVMASQLLLLAALFGLVIEGIQQYIPGRNASVLDGMANTFGLVVVMVLSWNRKFFSTRFIKKLEKWN